MPQPEAPTTAVTRAGGHLEVDAVQDGVTGEGLGEAGDLEGVGTHSAAALFDCRNSTSVTGTDSATSISAYGAAAA